MTQQPKSFEEQIEALEALVQKMEEGSMQLNETLAAYESGMQIVKSLQEDLSAAEKRMLELSEGKIVPMEDAP